MKQNAFTIISTITRCVGMPVPVLCHYMLQRLVLLKLEYHLKLPQTVVSDYI